MSHAYPLCTGPIRGAVSLGKNRVLVSVQGDGVTCYDITTRKPVVAWALGSIDKEFSSAAVYDYATNLCFAPVQPSGTTSAGKGSSVLAWSADATRGTITQLSRTIHLPVLHALFPVSHTPEGEEEEAAAAEAEEKLETEVDGSGEAQPGVLAVYAGGGVALCSGAEVVAGAEKARGQHTVSAAYQRGVLVTVQSDPHGSGTVSSTVYRVQGAQLQAESPVELVPPAAGCRALAAASTPERTVVLWSDGTVAIYLVPGDKQPLVPGPDFAGLARRPAVQRRLAGFRLPTGKQKGSSGGGAKKRRAAVEREVAGGGVGMVAVGEEQVAVVGWANNDEGVTMLRLVVLETNAACVQIAHDFVAGDVGLAVLDSSKPVQVERLGPGINQLAVTIGSAVLIVTCSDLRPPKLANLLGALAVDKALAAMRLRGSSVENGSDSGLLPLPAPGCWAAPGVGVPLLGSTAAVNPAAMAAARVLHPDELMALCEPLGGAPRPAEVSMELEEPTEPGQWLVKAKEVTWRCTDEEGDAAIAAEERRVWQEVQRSAAVALESDSALQVLLQPLLELRRSSGLELSPRLICRLLMLAAEKEHWGVAAAILAAQHPGLLSDVPGLAAAAAGAGQFAVMELLLSGSSETPAVEVTALLRVLLSPPSDDAAQEARRARHAAAREAADAAAMAAQQAAQQGAQVQAAATQQQQQQQLLPAALAAPGARERAVARCCEAAVQGLSQDDSCLNSLVAVHHRPPVLREALRSLTAQQAVQLLRYLTTMLRNHATLVGGCTVGWEPPLVLPQCVVLPPPEEVLAWANAILDANLVKLSHEPEAKELLQELRQLVDQQVVEAWPLLRLSGMLEHLLLQQQPRSAARLADYSVQWLDLRVVPPEQREQVAPPAQ